MKMKYFYYILGALLFFLFSLWSLVYSYKSYILSESIREHQTVLTEGNIGAKLASQERSESYVPPMNCTVSFSGFGEIAFLDVRGINSTIYCRRVISAFSKDSRFKTFNVNITDIPQNQKPLCRLIGENFTIDIFSKDSIGGYICNQWSQQL